MAKSKRTSFVIGFFSALVISAVLFAAMRFMDGPTTPTEAMPPPLYVEETSGIDHVYDGEWTFFVGGGVAAFDCDDDHLPDLFFAGGENPSMLYRNVSDIGGALRFEPVPDNGSVMLDVTGAYPIDIDSDGHIDLAVLRFGENVMLRGQGDCSFEEATELWGFNGGDDWTTAFSAKWEGSSSMPTLAFGNYVKLGENLSQSGECSDNVLLRPSSSNPTYAEATPLSPGWCSLSMLFSDWARTGNADLRIANDRHYSRDGEEQLWRVAAGEAPELYTREEGWKKVRIWGMGIASHDVTGDGYPEFYLSSQGDNKLQSLNDGSDGPSYTDIAIRRGLTAHRPFTGGDVLPSTAWHAEFQDVNNDGFIDLFVAKGNVEAQPDFASDDPNNLLIGQPDGSFVERAVEAGIVHFDRTRGAALVDLNLDGMLDLVEVNRRENVKVWRNVGWGTAADPEPMGHWIALRLDQEGGNRNAVGSWIETKIGDLVVRDEVTVGGGHAGGQLGWIHVGIGPSASAQVRVQWPDGNLGPWMDFNEGTFATITREASEPELWLR